MIPVSKSFRRNATAVAMVAQAMGMGGCASPVFTQQHAVIDGVKVPTNFYTKSGVLAPDDNCLASMVARAQPPVQKGYDQAEAGPGKPLAVAFNGCYAKDGELTSACKASRDAPDCPEPMIREPVRPRATRREMPTLRCLSGPVLIPVRGRTRPPD